MRRLVVLIALAILPAACATTNSGLSQTARAKLTPLVQQVRQATESFDSDAARRALADVRATVATLRRRGAITQSKADEILAAAAEVESRLALTPTTSTTTTTTTRPGKGNGNGKGKND